MDSGTRFEIDLPPDLAEALRALVESGEYEDVNAAVCEAMRRLIERDKAEEDWLRTTIAARAEALDEGRLGTKTPDEVRRSLAARTEARDRAA
ncbi:MAG: antitoxin ParD1/3/4 [Sphingomonadales bacterium]|nr:antitoxin ParD1/3/4 [Sphingomonadales bacterium]